MVKGDLGQNVPCTVVSPHLCSVYPVPPFAESLPSLAAVTKCTDGTQPQTFLSPTSHLWKLDVQAQGASMIDVFRDFSLEVVDAPSLQSFYF